MHTYSKKQHTTNTVFKKKMKRKKKAYLCVHKRRVSEIREKKTERKIEQYGISKRKKENFKTCFSV